jgi:hypothetical protein
MIRLMAAMHSIGRVRVTGLFNPEFFSFNDAVIPTSPIISMADRKNENGKKDGQLVAEYKYAETLMKAVTAKMDEYKRDAANSGQQVNKDTFALGEAERKLLLNINNTGLLEGTVAGLVALVGLRQFRHYMLRRVMEKVTNSTPSSTQTTTMVLTPKSPFRQQTANSPKDSIERAAKSPIWMALGWLTDLAGSFFLVAVPISFACTSQDKLLRDISAIPLVEGRSKISELFCPTIQAALSQCQRDATSPEEQAALSSPRTPHLTAWIAFAHNCHLRQTQEQLIRQQQGLSHNAPVSIPPPGVSSFSADDELSSTLGQQHDAIEDDSTGPVDGDFYDPNADTEFADDPVMDEIQKKKNNDSRRR